MPGSRRDVRSYPSASSCGLHSAYSPCAVTDHHFPLTKHGISTPVRPPCADSRAWRSAPGLQLHAAATHAASRCVLRTRLETMTAHMLLVERRVVVGHAQRGEAQEHDAGVRVAAVERRAVQLAIAAPAGQERAALVAHALGAQRSLRGH